MRLHYAAASILAGLAACTAHAQYIAGTKIPDNDVNHSVLGVVEAYRMAVEKGDAQALVLMASPKYSEDSGTPTIVDDYGFDGLQGVLASRFKEARDIRYSMKYVSIKATCAAPEAGCQAKVAVLIDASYTITDARGQARRLDKRDQNELVLEYTGDKWLFLSGM
ncbi:MAG TPA: hypothetical protein VL463_33585 [Kofleriaceae bacterium]|jgi:hypothetical protein|nr:hypothetical protein [Kofleriaceae bacterium]